MSMLLLMDDDGPSPAFSANFMSGSLPAGLTYTNSSTERIYWDASGTRRSAVANEPIFETLGGVFQGMRWEMEQRTNLATNSEGAAATWTVSNVSDAGTPIAGFSASLAFGDNSVQRSSRKAISHTTGLTYTVSVFVQMDDGLAPVLGVTTTSGDFYLYGPDGGACTVNPTITLIHGSIYRVSAGRTATTTTTTLIGPIKATTQSARTFRVIGIQVEAAAFASSYIPTAGSAVTRQPDVLTATSISPWYRQDEGTILFEGILSNTLGGIYVFSNGTINERIGGYISPSTSSFFCVDGGVAQADLTTMGAVSLGVMSRHVGAYKINDFAGVLNAGTVRTDTSGTIATINQLKFGALTAANANPLMGYARRFDYYRTRLPDAQIQGMSRV